MSAELGGSTGLEDSINRDGNLIFLEKAIRTVHFGFLGVIFGVSLAQLAFSASRIDGFIGQNILPTCSLME